MMTFAIGIFLFLQHYIEKKTVKRICWAMLFFGLLAPISRGPWVGAVIMYATFILFGKNALKNITQFIAASLAGLIILAASPFGSKLINYIPGFGNVDSGNVDYREKLIDVCLLVIAKNPILGDTKYLEDPLMEEMRQGQGIIDIVNAYLTVALSNGFVGLFLFLGMFISTLAMIYKAMKLVKGKSEEYHLLGRCLLAIIVASMFMIGSSGNQLALKTINWCLLGIGIAYWQIVKLQFSNKQIQPAVQVTESI
jgi:O-antigen ligase